MFPSWLTIPKESADLARAQIEAFQRDVTLVYCAIIIVIDVIAYVHWAQVPFALYAVVPGILNLICMARIAWWLMERRRLRQRTPDEARHRRLIAVLIGLLQSVSLFVWCVVLMQYGDSTTQLFTAFALWLAFITGAVASSRFQASLLLNFAVFTPAFVIFLLITDGPGFLPLAILATLTSAMIVLFLASSYRDFVALTTSRRDLQLQSDRLLTLSRDNDRLANIDVLTGLANPTAGASSPSSKAALPTPR